MNITTLEATDWSFDLQTMAVVCVSTVSQTDRLGYVLWKLMSKSSSHVFGQDIYTTS